MRTWNNWAEPDLTASLELAELAHVKPTVHPIRLEEINEVFTRMCTRPLPGRAVIDFS